MTKSEMWYSLWEHSLRAGDHYDHPLEVPMGSRVRTKYVPSHGPRDAEIMIVGEAPGAEEEQYGKPFIGRAGQLLNEYLGRAGIRRDMRPEQDVFYSEVFATNLSKYRPDQNRFANLLGSDELEKGIDELREEILDVDPAVIIACGGWPLWYLTGMCGWDRGKQKPGTGIKNYRGSVLPCTLAEGYKVVATLHPAFVIRAYGWAPVFTHDLERAVRHVNIEGLAYPEYEVLVDPPNLAELTEEMCNAEWLSFDIETFGPGIMSCFGVTDSIDRALVITFQNSGGFEYARRILESPAKKYGQYGTYDCNFLHHFYGWKVQNYAFDTYIAAAELMPEFPRGLDFLTSIYTDFPYYKEERKTWKETMDLSMLWEYNAKDVVATMVIANEQMKELEELYGWRMEQGSVVSLG